MSWWDDLAKGLVESEHPYRGIPKEDKLPPKPLQGRKKGIKISNCCPYGGPSHRILHLHAPFYSPKRNPPCNPHCSGLSYDVNRRQYWCVRCECIWTEKALVSVDI